MKKITLLLGAGAALPWNAPSTLDITNAIKNSEDHLVNDIPFGTWIDNILGGTSGNRNLNFETYIDFVESICTHLLSTNNEEISTSTLLNSIFDLKDEIANGVKELKWNNNSSFQSALHKMISTYYSMIRIVGNHIHKYLSSFEDGDFELNNKLRDFCEHFIDLGFAVRTYTLNYDRCIPLIFESGSSKHEIFDGFDISNKSNDGLFLLNKSRILSDINCHSFYNLHGSFHWNFQGPPYVINSSKRYKHQPQNPDIAEYPIHSNANEKLLQSSIITGFKKTQRINFEPYSYFFNSFFKDIHESEILIIIGYSHSDPHINQLINEAIRNKKRVYSVTWQNSSSAISQHGYGGKVGTIVKNHHPEYTDWYQAGGSYYSEYPKGFKHFLDCREWINIQPL